MNTIASQQSVKNIKSYILWNDFNLVCHQALHSNPLDTPPEHEHKDFYELVIVASGSGVHQLVSQEWQISSGNVFLIPPKKSHCYKKYNNLLIYNLIFSEKFLRLFLADLSRLPGFQLLFNLEVKETIRHPSDGIRIKEEYFPEVIELLDRMNKLNHSMEIGDKTMMLSLFAHVMLLLARHVHFAGNLTQLYYVEKLSALLSELEHHFEVQWNLEKMAKFCNMSISSFRQSFKSFTGVSPIEYLLSLRLSKAARFLEYSSNSLEEIALQSGFGDVNYFAKQFKKHFDIQPSKYRRECQYGQRPPTLSIKNK